MSRARRSVSEERDGLEALARLWKREPWHIPDERPRGRGFLERVLRYRLYAQDGGLTHPAQIARWIFGAKDPEPVRSTRIVRRLIDRLLVEARALSESRKLPPRRGRKLAKDIEEHRASGRIRALDARKRTEVLGLERAAILSATRALDRIVKPLPPRHILTAPLLYDAAGRLFLGRQCARKRCGKPFIPLRTGHRFHAPSCATAERVARHRKRV